MATVTAPAPAARAQVRFVRMSARKARAVLDLIRGQSVAEASETLVLSERGPADVVAKCLGSAVANAENNDHLDPDELYVAECYADEGPTLRRFRPRARGRATRIRKRTCHITVVLGRYDADELEELRRRQEARGTSRRDVGEERRRRVARSRGEDVDDEDDLAEEPEADDEEIEDETTDETAVDEDAGEDVDEVDETQADVPPEAELEAAGTAADDGDTVESLVDDNTKDELLALAEAEGVEVAKSGTKAAIAEAIIAAREDS